MGRRTDLSRLADIAGRVSLAPGRGSGPLSASSSVLDKLEPPKAVTAPQYHLYVHLAPVRMLLTFYKSQKHVKSTWQSQKNLSRFELSNTRMAGLLWLSESTNRVSWHPSNHNRENVISMQNWEKRGPVIGCILLISVVPLAYSLSHEKHDVSSFPPIPNIAGAARHHGEQRR